MLIVFARQDSLWPALIILFLLGLPVGAVNMSVGPLLMHVILYEIMGRVMSVFGTSRTLCNAIAALLAGLLGTFRYGASDERRMLATCRKSVEACG